jgi:hypothetical protein
MKKPKLKTIKISISKIEDYRLWTEDVPFLPEDWLEFCEERLLRKTVQNEAMKLGNAFHDWIEKGGPDGDFTYLNKNGKHTEEIFIPSVELRKVKKWVRDTHPYRDPEVVVPAWEIIVGEFRFIITGRIDGDLGIGVEDHKLKQGKPPKELYQSYENALPWQFYLAMTGKEIFFYNIFYRYMNRQDYIKTPGGSMLIHTPQIELIEQIKLFPYVGMKERCFRIAWEFFSLMIETGIADRIHKKQSKWSPEYRKEPEVIVPIGAKDFRTSELDLNKAAKSVEEFTKAVNAIVPPYDPLGAEVEPDFENFKDLIRKQNIGLFYPGQSEPNGEPIQIMILELKDNLEITFSDAQGKEFESLVCQIEDLSNCINAMTFEGLIVIDPKFDPEAALAQDDGILDEPAPEEETDLRKVKKALLALVGRANLVSLDGGKSYGMLTKVNKRGERIRIEVEPDEGETQVEFVVSMLPDGDFRTSGNRIINTLPF